jgi:hypothetical protein
MRIEVLKLLRLEQFEKDGLWNRVLNRKRRANLLLSL